MPHLYVAVYLARQPDLSSCDPIPSAAVAFRGAAQFRFPYDVGDDPAFFSAQHFGGPITWGVCRPDVRCAIRRDDGIVFFAAQKNSKDNRTTDYRFVAALRVNDKIRHTEVSQHPIFKHYLNLMIRPRGAGWEHYEPAANPVHRDWLWRITCKSSTSSCDLPPKVQIHTDEAGNKEKVRCWEAAGKAHEPGSPLMIGKQPVPVAANYVIFSTTSVVLADDPPRVARYREGGHEAWQTDPTSQKIRDLVLRNGRYLRTSNYQQPHRHIRHQLAESDLQNIFDQLGSLMNTGSFKELHRANSARAHKPHHRISKDGRSPTEQIAPGSATAAMGQEEP